MSLPGPLISIVDDLSARRALQRLVQSASDAVETVASAHEFLDTRIPMIVITAHDDAATSVRVWQSSVAAYRHKPSDRQVLRDAIEFPVQPETGRTS